VRAEVLGALVNAVFLLALCFAIFVEAIERLTLGEAEVNDPDSMLYVGIVGLLFNLVALALFSQAGNSGGGSPRAVQGLSGRQDAESANDGE